VPRRGLSIEDATVIHRRHGTMIASRRSAHTLDGERQL